ncbi:DUF58 domain-containing protein [soil metagenome]
MREALAGLTVRGRAFLAAGLTAIVCAILLGQPALTRVGVLVVVLPLATALLLGRARYRLALVRTTSPQLVAAGQPARVTLSLTNEGRTPSGVLLLEDHVPYVLGTRPRFVVDGVGHGWRRQVSYQVRSDVRGRFEIGPMTVRVSDAFGLVELGRAFRTTVPLVVTPRISPLPAVPLGGGWTGSGDNRPRAFAFGSAEDVTVRDYRQGDDLRRVHWRSSARTGELMVRREEQPWQSRATLLIDNRLLSHRGQGIASSLAAAVTVTASVAVHLSQRGFTVRLVTAGGEDGASAWHLRDSELNTGPLLEALAVLQTDNRSRLDTSWMGEQGQGGLTIGIFGSLDQQDVPLLRRISHHTTSAMAIALDVEGWSGGRGESRGGSAPVLTSAGWRAVTFGPQDRIDSTWEELGRMSTTRGGTTAPAGRA